jgi:hypothetical protein
VNWTKSQKMVDDSVNRGIPVSDLDRYIETLSDCKPLTEPEVRLLCEKAREIFFNESNVQPVKCPVTVVGDMYVFSTFMGHRSFLAMANSMTCSKCSESGAHPLIRITYFLVIMWIAVTSALRFSLCFFVSRCVFLIEVCFD